MITATFIGLLAFGFRRAPPLPPSAVFLAGLRLYVARAANACALERTIRNVTAFLRTIFSAAIGTVFGAALLLARLEMTTLWQFVAFAVALAASAFNQSAVRIFTIAAAAGAARYFISN